MSSELTSVQHEIQRLEDAILDLQDIVFEENIPQSEREDICYIGVRWHTPEQVQQAKQKMAQYEERLQTLHERESYLLAMGMR